MKPRLVVIGNGMVGLRFLEELVKRRADEFDITVIGGEARPAYNRVLLSPLLAAEIGEDDVLLQSSDWYDEHGINLRLGVPATKLDAQQKSVSLADGTRLAFDMCVLALGSSPIRLPLPGSHLQGVHTFREFTDVEAFQQLAYTKSPAVVIGGGLLGIETAYGLSRAGVPVTLIHLMDRLMERQLDAEGGRLLAGALEARGISVRLKASTDRIEDDGTGSVSGITLKDGRSIPAAAVIMAVGVRANTQLATGAGLTVERGIVVADDLSTSCPGMYAIGECAQHDGSVYGLVEPGYDQARILAQHLTGDDGGAYTGNVLSTNLKVSGVPVFSAGDFSDEAAQSIITRDPAHNAYRRFFIKDDRLVGTVLVGDTGDALWYRDLIADQTDISDMRDNLAFGRTFAQAA